MPNELELLLSAVATNFSATSKVSIENIWPVRTTS
jgi:hypothetical protein